MDINAIEETTEYPPPRLIVYSEPGIGKSTFASQAPNPIFMDLENGLGGINSKKAKADTWMGVLDILNSLATQNHNRQTLAIDGITEMEKIIWKTIAASNKVSTISDVGYGKGYDQALEFWGVLTEKLDVLRDKRGMIVILCAHEKVLKFDDPMGPGYHTYEISIHHKAATRLIAWADGVFFLKDKTVITTEKGGFTGEIRKAKSGGVYLHAQGTPAYIAKNRKFLSLPSEFPISEYSGWNDFIAQIGKGNQQQIGVQTNAS